jgi:phosphatidylglycerophosphate synthase
MVVLAWMVIVVAVGAVLISAMRSVAEAHNSYLATALARILLATALVLFIVSAVQRLLPPASICCGSAPAEIQEAIHLAK